MENTLWCKPALSVENKNNGIKLIAICICVYWVFNLSTLGIFSAQTVYFKRFKIIFFVRDSIISREVKQIDSYTLKSQNNSS